MGKSSMSRAALQAAVLFIIGILLGIITKLLDIYTTNIGNVFSQMSVWIFLCTVIAIYSKTAFKAAANVFAFCIGMVAAYYMTALLTASVYSSMFVWGWSLFAVFTLALGFIAWHAKGKGFISWMIAICILLGMLAAAVLLFDRIRISDIAFAALTGAVLFRSRAVTIHR